MKSGKLIVFSAPSGSGKTSIVHYLMEQPELNLAFSVSATSRKPRGMEKHGVDYYFIDKKEFLAEVATDAFAEWEEVYKGLYYGTYKKEIDRLLKEGKNVIFDIDVVGGLNIKKLYPEKTLAIFVKPPSIEVLEARLRIRKTDTEEKIKERVAKATYELSFENEFDYVVVNDNLKKAQKEAYNTVKAFIEKEVNR